MATPKFAAGEQAVVLDPRGHAYVRVQTVTARRVVVAWYGVPVVFRRRRADGPFTAPRNRVLVSVAMAREIREVAAACASDTAAVAARFERAHPEETPGWERVVAPQAVVGGPASPSRSPGDFDAGRRF